MSNDLEKKAEQQIEKILKEQIKYVPQVEGFVVHGAIRELQKLFLQKQIELLGGLQSVGSPSILNKKIILEAELKSLEP